MKKGWEKRRLGEVLQIQNGYAFDSKRFNPSKGPPLVRIRSLKSGTERETRYSGDYDEKYLVQKGDLLIGMDGEFGCYEWKGESSLLNQRVCRLQGFAKELLPRFLFYGVNDHLKAIEDVTGYATVKHLSSKQILDIEFLVPPLTEQQRIVGVLDEAFEGLATAKANAETNLQNARALFESHLQSVFTQRGKGWMEKRLGDLSQINYGYTESASAQKVGPHFLRITDIRDNRVDWATVPFCPIDKKDLPKYKLADGDIVFARTGATTGKSYLVTVPPDAVFASYLIRVRLQEKELLPKFVDLFFQTHSYWDTIRAGVSGSAQGGFNATKLAELLIPFPHSLKEQEAIAEKLSFFAKETQRLTHIYEQKLTALEALKKSLLHQAFSGEL